MKILYVGKLIPGSTSLQRYQALIDIGYEVIPIDTFPEHVSNKYKKIFNRINRRIFGPKDDAKANIAICDYLLVKNDFEILWIDKGMTINSSTLNLVKLYNPLLKIIGYSPDDMGSSHNQSRRFISTLPCYDFYITTKSYGLNELKQLGAKKVLMIDNAYDENTHFPITTDTTFADLEYNAVGFIGTFEKERSQSIKFAANNGIKISIYGSGWNGFKIKNVNVASPVIGHNYTKAINSFKINLCFLRKINRDLQTTRSIEIPACGGFMLAERSDEHLYLFKEGVEAEYFSSSEEMCDKINFYLNNPELRKKIAIQGRRRCVVSGYSNQKRLKKIITEIYSLEL